MCLNTISRQEILKKQWNFAKVLNTGRGRGGSGKWEEYSPTSLLFTEYNQIHREIMQVVETQIHKTFILCTQTPSTILFKIRNRELETLQPPCPEAQSFENEANYCPQLEVVDFQQVLICFLVWEYYNFCGIKNLINVALYC